MHGGEPWLVVTSVEEHLQSFLKRERERRGDGQKAAASFTPPHSQM